MLQKIILQCKYQGEQEANYHWGSLMHGMILEKLPVDVVKMLHESKLRPFSQYLIPKPEQKLSWHIGLWDKNVAEIIEPILVSLQQFTIKHKGISLEVVEVDKRIISYQDYFANFFVSANVCRRYEVNFLTPCSHKRDGQYVIFPTVDLMIQSVAKRYCAFIHDFSLDDPEAITQIIQHMRIVRYSLRSAVYYLNGTKITGYLGKITIQIQGPEQLARLAGALLSFAEYAGLGIKTALGMGGVRIIPK